MDKKYKTFSRKWHEEWTTRNCGTCKKGYDTRHSVYDCKFQLALDAAYCGRGQITTEVAKAIGYLDSEGADLWECPGWARGRK